jgi:aminopeptidase N
MFNTISGKNLNWYWQRWFYDWGYPNLAIKHVEKKDDGYEISIQSKGTKPVPINIVAEYEDGTKEKLHRSCEVWKDTSETTLKTSSAKAIKKITLGDTYDVDIDKSDNIYLPAK